MSQLSRERILALFDALNDRLAEREIRGELYVVGGAVLCLVHRTRAATNDVDAVFAPPSLIRELAASVARDFDLDDDWLNDGVKGFLSERRDFDPFLDLSYLRVMTASSEYLFAMKAISMRLGAEFHDLGDVRFLLRYLGIRSFDEAITVLDRYYPRDRVPKKTLYALQELVEDMDG